MQEIAFNIPVSGTVRIENSKIIITFNQAETTIDLNDMPKNRTRISLDKGQTVFDIVLQTAQRVIDTSQQNRFSGAELYHEALKEHPDLKRNSWSGHVIASAPNHPSYHHFATRKDYFRYLGNGIYKLESRYKKIDENKPEEG
jgi:hypothetical protein